MVRPANIKERKDSTQLQRVSEKRLYEDDVNNIKEIYNKIKELKEEIEFTKDNELITDLHKKQKYINDLEHEIYMLQQELEFHEKMFNILEKTVDSVDDYLDKKGNVKEIDFWYNNSRSQF